MARASIAVQPDAESLEDRAALLAEIARLRAQAAAAPPEPVKPAPVVAGPPLEDTDPAPTPLEIPRQFHGVYLRDPIVHCGKTFNPGSTYKTGSNGKPITVGEKRTILAMASHACHLLATKDVDHGQIVSLGRFHGESE